MQADNLGVLRDYALLVGIVHFLYGVAFPKARRLVFLRNGSRGLLLQRHAGLLRSGRHRLRFSFKTPRYRRLVCDAGGVDHEPLNNVFDDVAYLGRGLNPCGGKLVLGDEIPNRFSGAL